MTDREKVIKGVQYCLDYYDSQCEKCPYQATEEEKKHFDWDCHKDDLRRNVLALLKEREPVKPIEVNETVKIIQHGNYYNKWLRFKCDCGCVFETTRFGIGHDYFCASCPECNNDVIIPKPEKEDE